MKILLLKTLNDGRRVLVYDDFTEKENITIIVKNKFSIIPETIKLSDSEEKWRDELPNILRLTKEEFDN